MSIIIFGAGGMLGTAFVAKKKLFEKQFSPVFLAYRSKPKSSGGKNLFPISFDATDLPGIKTLLMNINPEIIINCAAMTNIEDCEKNPDLAHKLNAEFPEILARWAAKYGKKLIHYSTDSVFDGKNPPLKGYTETDEPNPLNAYAKSKLRGEKLIQLADSSALILRINIIGVRGRKPFPLAEWILRSLASGQKISGFTNVFFAPLFTEDNVRLTLKALQNNLSGLYHLNAKDYVSKYDFAKLLAKEFCYSRSLIYPSSSTQELSVSRPLKTYLSSSTFAKKAKVSLPTVTQGIARLHQRIKNDKFRL